MDGLRSLLVVLPGLLVLAAGVVLSPFNAGFEPSAWYAAGFFLLILVMLVATLETGTPSRFDRLPRVALVAYAIFVAWNFAGMLWADIPGDAWTGANRALLYGLAVGVILSRPWPRAGAAAALCVTGFGILLVAIGVLIAISAGEITSFFVRGRLDEPAGYANAAASLWLVGFFALLHLAVSRILPAPARALSLGGACVLIQTAVLTQSRGALIALIAAVAVYLICAPERWRAIGALVAIGGATALAFDSLISVREAATAAELSSDFDTARGAIALSGLAVGVLAGLALLLGRAGATRPLEGPRAARAGNVAMGALGVGAIVIFLLAIGSPRAWVDERWDDFRSGYDAVESGETRFGGSLGSNRYDFYRVALREFRDHPVGGIGADNFAVPYLQARRSGEAPRHPHGLPFRLLSQYGLVGTIAFLAFLAALLTGVGRVLLRAERIERGLAAGCVAAFTVWFVQGLADWLWAFPALGVMALGLLAVASRLEHGDHAVWARAVRGDARPRAVARLALAALAMAAGVSLALPGVAARYTSAAYSNSSDTGTAEVLDRLARAADLDFLSADPLVARGVIARRAGEPQISRESFVRAAEREPDDWFVRFELGLTYAVEDRPRAATRELEAARRLNPRQPLVSAALSAVRAGREIDPIRIERRLSRQLTSKLRPVDAD